MYHKFFHEHLWRGLMWVAWSRSHLWPPDSICYEAVDGKRHDLRRGAGEVDDGRTEVKGQLATEECPKESVGGLKPCHDG